MSVCPSTQTEVTSAEQQTNVEANKPLAGSLPRIGKSQSALTPARRLTPSSFFTFTRRGPPQTSQATSEVDAKETLPPAEDSHLPSAALSERVREKPPLPPKPLHLSAPSRSLLPSVSEHAPVVVKPARRSSSRLSTLNGSKSCLKRYSPSPPKRLSRTSSASSNLIRLSSVKSSSVLHPNVTLRRKHTLMASASTAVLPSATVPSSSLSQTEPSETPKRIIGSSPLTRSMMRRLSRDAEPPVDTNGTPTSRKIPRLNAFTSTSVLEKSSSALSEASSPKKALSRVTSSVNLPPRSFFLKPSVKRRRLDLKSAEEEPSSDKESCESAPKSLKIEEGSQMEDKTDIVEESGYFSVSETQYSSQECLSSQQSEAAEEKDEKNKEEPSRAPLNWPRPGAIKKPTNFRELYSRLRDADVSVSPRTRARRVAFNNVDVFLFQRAQGFSTVPDNGEVALGMRSRHFDVRRICLRTGVLLDKNEVCEPVPPEIVEEELQSSPRKGAPSRNTETAAPRPEEDAASEESALDDDDEVEEGEDIGWSSQFGAGDIPCMPFMPQKRVLLLRQNGVKIVKADGPRCQELRETRRQCGCTCVDGICLPETCECALNDIQCQDDQQGIPYPCACQEETCINPSGRISFSPQRVRQHHLTTMQRLRDQRRSSIFESPQRIVFADEDEEKNSLETPISVKSEGVPTTAPIEATASFIIPIVPFPASEAPSTPVPPQLHAQEEATPLGPIGPQLPISTPTTLPGEGKTSIYPVTPTYNKNGKRSRLTSQTSDDEMDEEKIMRSVYRTAFDETVPALSTETPTRYFPPTPSLL